MMLEYVIFGLVTHSVLVEDRLKLLALRNSPEAFVPLEIPSATSMKSKTLGRCLRADRDVR